MNKVLVQNVNDDYNYMHFLVVLSHERPNDESQVKLFAQL